VFTWFCLEVRTIRSCEASGKSRTENKSVILPLSASLVQDSLRSSLLLTLWTVIVRIFKFVLELQSLKFDDDDSVMNHWELLKKLLQFELNWILVKLGFDECSSCSWLFLDFLRILIEKSEREKMWMCLWCGVQSVALSDTVCYLYPAMCAWDPMRKCHVSWTVTNSFLAAFWTWAFCAISKFLRTALQFKKKDWTATNWTNWLNCKIKKNVYRTEKEQSGPKCNY
jgi:hypothetical protein